MAAVLIDQGQGERAGEILRQAARSGRSPALDYEVARWEALHRRLPQAATLFRAVTRADPNHLQARYGLARTLALMGHADEAAGAYTALLKRDPDNRQILSELAYLRGTQRRFAEALALYDRLEQTGADMVREISQVALGMMHVCDWSVRESLTARLASRMSVVRPAIFETYALLAGADDPALHRRMAERFAGALRDASATRERPAPRPIGPADRRLRIGYLTGDFNQHATALLLAGVIEAHDRAAFEIFAYDYSPEDGSPMRARMVAAFEHFVRLGDESPSASAARIAADEIDILIDLKGYTERSRTEILCLRPAPVQVSFLGYAGTQGAEWIDYVIADATVLPPEQQSHWVEQAVRLPASAWPSDRSRPLPDAPADRAAYGLPADGVAFACFCNPFKITPAMFANWMEILRRVPGSVLWLYEANALAPGNLRREARAAGIDPARLVFAPPVALEEHLARHACADVFLDTAPFGAHTTGLDALWAGVPMVTCRGESMASLAGASLLRAAGLPELIASDNAGYVELAVGLATDPARRLALRAHLLAGRDNSPLFDAAAFARALERAFLQMAAASREGLAAGAFDVS
jgi:protein O-GlcNAc transferase